MVCWIIFHLSLDTCIVLSDSNQVVGSFYPNDLEEMYALPTLEKNLNKQFLDAFVKKEVIDEEI